MALDYPRLLNELQVESDRLVSLLSGLKPRQWESATPAAGWAVRDQVSHLAYFDEAARIAATEADRFQDESAALMAAGMNFPDRIAEEFRHLGVVELLKWFVQARVGMMHSFRASDPRTRLPWYGPDMSVASSATARLMETWAHGQDIYDTVGVVHPVSPGLHSIAHLGVSTFGFVHRLHGRKVPDEAVRVELKAPDSDDIWIWGPETSANVVSGPAEDFALMVTQRRNVTDTALTVVGDVATSWVSIAQAFAGAPGPGRPSTSTSTSTGGTND